MLKRTVSLVIVLAITLTLSTHLSASQMTSLAAADEIPLVKDETVYVHLNHDGSVRTTQVVNHIDTPKAGRYSDVGHYSEIRSLSSNLEPTVDGNKVIWQLPASDSGFYYQGTMTNREAPFSFSITYTLDGKSIAAQDLVGRSGRVELLVKVSPSQSVSGYFADNFLCQLQIPLSLDRASNISAPGAQSVTVGRTKTLAYMVLPGQSKEFKLAFDAKSFEMDAISGTLIPFSLREIIQFDPKQITSGVNQISQATGTLVTGTEQLRDGTAVLGAGIDAAAKGAEGLAAGAGELESGITRYATGIAELMSGVKQLDGGLSQLSDQGPQLAHGYDEVVSGLSGLLDRLEPLLASLPAEQGVQYSQQIQYLKEQLNTYGVGLKSYTTNVAQSSHGLGAVATGMAAIGQNGSTLAAGAAVLHNGAVQVHAALKGLGTGATRIPVEMQKLIDGQRELRSGILDAEQLLTEFVGEPGGSETEPVSFVDQTNRVNSVQFVIRTPELKANSTPIVAPTTVKALSFWERLMKLFR